MHKTVELVKGQWLYLKCSESELNAGFVIRQEKVCIVIHYTALVVS